jgi:hypothetical protein
MKILPQEINALRHFKAMNPWSGSVETRKKKFLWLHREWNKIHNESWRLTFEVPNSCKKWTFSGSSYCNPATKSIILRGRLSVITFLHEWGHALGLTQLNAQSYAISLFKEVFPENMANLHSYDYCLVKRKRGE